MAISTHAGERVLSNLEYGLTIDFKLNRLNKISNEIKRLLKHTLYIKVLILLLCISFSVTLMQAGSLFLLDYIPSNHAAVQYVYQQKLLWLQLQDRQARQDASAQAKSQDAKFAGQDINLDINLDASQLQDQQNRIKELARSLSVEPAQATDKRNSDDLASAFEAVLHAYSTLAIADQELAAREKNAGQAGPHESKSNQASSNQAVSMLDMAHAYEQLAMALQRDVEIKQSVVSLLQLMGLLLVMTCLGAIAFGAKKLLVQRMDALRTFVPAELLSSQEVHEQADHDQHDNQLNDIDEFVAVERLVYELSARLEGFKAENEWFNQTNSERLRSMVRAQDFLHKFMELVSQSVVTETALRKIIYLLERALNVNNVAIIFTESDTGVSAERLLFSHHKPTGLHEELFDEVTVANFVSFLHENEDGMKSQCLAVGFSSPSGALGVLKIEADEDHLFDDTEVQLVEVTAQLLSMMMGFQGREQEGRRVALLEERAAIARELHDSLAQSLSFMKIQIARLQSQAVMPAAGPPSMPISSTAMQDIVTDLQQGLDNAYRELRELLATFRVHMDVRGLSVAMQSAIDEFMQRSNLTITLDNRLVNCRLTVNEEFHILHVIREALSNVVRHADANTAVVSLVLQSSGDVMVAVDDDGIGYTSQEQDADHYGQKIMQERAYSLGGNIAVLRRRTGGTRVRLLFTPKLPQ